MAATSASAASAGRPGRNDRCPCGSGRKFKQCCGGSARAAIAGADAAAAASPADRLAAEPRHRQGLALLAAGKPAAALAPLHRAAALDPSSAAIRHALGRALLHSGRAAEAIATLQLAIVLREDAAAAHHDLALALEAAGRGREAIAACRRALALTATAESHRLLGDLLEAAGETAEAADCFRRAAAVGDAAPRPLDMVRALLLDGDLAAAETCLREAIAAAPGNDELFKVLGEVLAKQGRFDEAVAACDQALRLNRLQVPAHLTAVRARRCTEADRPRLARMLATLRDPGVRDEHRLFLHFAIGKLLDDIGDYRAAMRHFELANAIRGRTVEFDRAGLAEVIDRLIRRYTPEFFAAAAGAGFATADATPLFIVGMPRSGTTLIEQIVSSHPEVQAGEELFFWSNRAASRGVAEATALTPYAARALAAEYLALLRRIGPAAARVTDKQTFNFQQIGLIHLLLPQARFIHCRRHPVDTCLSMHFSYFKGRIPFISSKADLAFAYREYARLMAHWRVVIPPDRLFEIDYERLVADRAATTRRLIAFAGLAWHQACLAPERNRRTVTTASLWQARQPVFASSVARWRHYEPWLGELRQLLGLPEAAASPLAG